MSFSLSVLAQTLPVDLLSRWKGSLTDYGLHCEFPPVFSFSGWGGGYLPVRLEVEQGSFRSAGRYGREPLLAGFEFDISETAPWWEESELTSAVRARLRRVKKEFFLETHMGRTVADLRLQCFAAATLAIITEGVLYDGQRGEYYLDEGAVGAASAEVEEYEASLVGAADWENIAFPGWEAVGCGAT